MPFIGRREAWKSLLHYWKNANIFREEVKIFFYYFNHYITIFFQDDRNCRFCFIEKRGFIVFQSNVFLITIDVTKKLRCFANACLLLSVLCFKNLLRSSVLFIIASEISLLINGLWFSPIVFRLSGTYLYNASVQILQKSKNLFSSGKMNWVPNLTLKEFVKVLFEISCNICKIKPSVFVCKIAFLR